MFKGKWRIRSTQKTRPASLRKDLHKRRRNEMLVAICAFVLVLVLTSIQVAQLNAGDVLFVAVFNINFILLLGILFVVLRNAFTLILQRRRKVLGSKLRVRLVIAFVSFSLLPCLLMLLVTTQFVQLSMDFWFKDQTENSMESALELAHHVYDRTGERLRSDGSSVLERAEKGKILFSSPKGLSFLQKEQELLQISFLGYLTANKEEFVSEESQQQGISWTKELARINWEELEKGSNLRYLFSGTTDDFAFVILPINKGASGYLFLGDSMGKDFQQKLDRIVKGKGEYKNLRKLRRPLSRMLYSSLAVLSSLIVLSAIWFAFRLAREISSPVHALAAGTAAIAKGEFSVRLEDQSQDELAMLIQSFNAMATELEKQQKEITRAKIILEEQNTSIARHSHYIESILNTVASGVLSFNNDGYVSTSNAAAYSILQKTESEVLGEHISNLFPEHTHNFFQTVLNKLKEHPHSQFQHTVSMSFQNDSGHEEKRLLLTIIGLSFANNHTGAIAVFEDISELEHKQRIEAWREVARRIAHEIKNPLTPIKLSAQRLSKKFGSKVNDPAFNESTELIVQQVDHLLSMVQEFSVFAKLPEIKLDFANPLPLVQETVKLFETSHPFIHWSIEHSDHIPAIPMDREALQRVFINIYTNAVEILQLFHAPNPSVWTQIHTDQKVGMLKIDIADNGPGLSSEERARLFEPYFSHKENGTGLGLAIVRSIIADHRGYVRASNRKQGGTIISIELPLN